MNKNQKPSEMVIPSIRKCCWCGKPKKRGKGKSCMVSASGLGKRYYWNCGCLDNYSFTEFTELLFEKGMDYPKEFKKV